ncbi:MAG TPA: transglutaminase-like cysteine peptidase [Afifellaceae bacterium]|nr:transglutaminase-like cysteine peptidase [Afifellaceae bacterium]
MAYRRPAIGLTALLLAGCSSFEEPSGSLTAAHGNPASTGLRQSVSPTPHLSAFRPAHAPRGFAAVCADYPWACSSDAAGTVTSDEEILALARRVNGRVNRRVRPLSDAEQFGVPERWTLPLSGAGDCEDYVLLKLKLMIEAGVPADRLFMAQVMPRDFSQHVVLVVRTAAGDYVLDNLRPGIRLWHKTGYAFLKMQNRDDAGRWDVVLLGPRTSRY